MIVNKKTTILIEYDECVYSTFWVPNFHSFIKKLTKGSKCIHEDDNVLASCNGVPTRRKV